MVTGVSLGIQLPAAGNYLSPRGSPSRDWTMGPHGLRRFRLCPQTGKMTLPRVTVLLPSYNPSRDYALECFAGLETQTFGDFEVLIIDESDAETHAFLVEYKTKFAKRVLRPPRRLGLAGSLNYG